MIYNFDEPIVRKGTNTVKYDLMAEQYGDEDLIGMRIADTDFAPPPSFIEAMEACLRQRVIGYTQQYNKVHENISSFYERHANFKIDPTWLDFASPGLLPVVSLNIKLHSQEGDHVAAFYPGYFPLTRSIVSNNRQLNAIPLDYDNKTGKYTINWDKFENALTPKTKIFLLCNPHNPIGRVWSKDELKRIGEACLQKGIVVISDEIHAFLNFPEFPYTPMASISEDIAKNTISCFAPGKLFDIPGLMYAFSAIPNPKWKKLYTDALISTAMCFAERNLFGLRALEACYSDKNDEWIAQKVKYIQESSRIVNDYMSTHIPKILPTPVEGSFLRWLNFRAYGLNDDELENKLIREAHVALMRGSDFGEGGTGFCRMNIGCTHATLKEALDRIRKAFGN